MKMLRPALVLVALLVSASARSEEERAPTPPAPAAEPLVFLGVNDHGAEEWWRSKDGAVVVRVPGGTYLRRPYEGTVASADPKPVEVPSFLVDLTEVTNEQFARFLSERRDAAELIRADVPGLVPPQVVGHDDTRLLRPIFGPWTAAPGMARMPVTACTGRGAAEFVKWAGARFPSSDEWQKAASGTDGRLYPWGDDPPDAARANFGRPEPRGPAPVGSHPLGASPYGCLDMAGNVYERVLARARGGDLLAVMLKGGSWATPHPLNLRVLDLCMQPVEVADRTVGFRCVMDDPEPARPPRVREEPARLRWTADWDAALRDARARRVPVFLTLQHDTCGQCDRTRAQLFRDRRFVAYCNEKMVCVAGHVSGDALGDPHPPGDGGACPLYPGLTCEQHEESYGHGLAVVGSFVVTPGNFVLDPSAAAPGAGASAVLVPELDLPKWGDDVEGTLRAFDAARAKLAAPPAPAEPARDEAK